MTAGPVPVVNLMQKQSHGIKSLNRSLDQGSTAKKLKTAAASVSVLDLFEAWSSSDGETTVDRDKISSFKKIHVYDLDKCLLKTPEPNPLLFRKAGIELLESQQLIGGGWWRDPRFLEPIASDSCEQEIWDAKWWNGSLVELAKQSFNDPDVFSVLISERNHRSFQKLMKHLLTRRQLLFDGYILQQEETSGRHHSSLDYKANVVAGLVSTFANLEQITIYDGRIKHLERLKHVVEKYNQANKRDIFINAVIAQELPLYYDPLEERRLVTQVIEGHNMELMTNPNSKVRAGHVEMSIAVKSSEYVFDRDSIAVLADFLQSRIEESQFQTCNICESIPINPKGVLPPDFEEHKGETVEWNLIKFSHSAPHVWSASAIPCTQALKHITGDKVRTITIAHNPSANSKVPFNFKNESLDEPLMLKTTIEEKMAIQFIRRRH
jgi:hypothetical protein